MSKAQPHPGHEKCLCKMVGDKVQIEKIKSLVKNAKYISKGCMRTAAKAENLCAPEPLQKSFLGDAKRKQAYQTPPTNSFFCNTKTSINIKHFV